MCGICYVYTAKGKASNLAFKRYQDQKTRGSEGYGAVCISRRVVDKVYRSEKEDGIKPILHNKSDMVLLHHRRPTSTPNFEECTHPIYVTNEKLEYDYYVVHNGIISNPDELKKKFNELGFKYTTEIEEAYVTKGKHYKTGKTKFNDSESLAIDLAICIEEGKTATESKGSIAFVALQVNKETKIVENVFYGRNANSPLVVDNQYGNLVIASEGKGTVVNIHTLYCFDTKTRKTTDSPFDVGLNYTYVTPTAHSEDSGRRISEYHNHGMGFLPPRRSEKTSTLDYVKRHNATHDIIRARHERIEKNLSKKDKRRLRFSVKEHTTNVADKHGLVEQIKYITKGDHLIYTYIYKDDILRSMLGYHWEWYNRVLKEKIEYEKEISRNKKNMDFKKDDLVAKLKACSMQFDAISASVNALAKDDIENRRILEEASYVQDQWEKEAQEEVAKREKELRGM